MPLRAGMQTKSNWSPGPGAKILGEIAFSRSQF
jgi:hypothetical protein